MAYYHYVSLENGVETEIFATMVLITAKENISGN
jgi:hypothetical protein